MDEIEKLIQGENGHFILDSRDGRAILTVYPGGKGGRAVQAADVEARIKLFGITGTNKAVLESIVADADSMPHDVGMFPEPDPVPSSVEVEVSPDGMEAWFIVHPAQHGGAPLDRAMIQAALSAKNVTHGVREEWISQVLASEETGVFRAIAARGTEILPAVSEHLEFILDPHPHPEPDPAAKKIDFKKRSVIQTCESGQLLARLLPGQPGHSGVDVTGRVLEEASSPGIEVVPGKNIKKQANDFYSAHSGHFRAREMRIGPLRRFYLDVDDVLHLDNVDFSTGHIQFPGTVIVHGTVADGFDVHAEGDVIVEKSVGSVHIRAGGDIRLLEGIVGRRDASLIAQGEVLSNFVQEASVFARGNIIIAEGALNSRLVSGGDVQIEDGRGELIGGECICSGSLRANRIGSRLETPTRITLGIDPDTLEQLRSLDSELIEKQRTLERVNKNLAMLAERGKKGAVEPDTEKKLLALKENYSHSVRSLDKQRRRLQEKVLPNPRSELVTLEAFPGMEVNFGVGTPAYRVSGRSVHHLKLKLENGRVYPVRF
jgi:uncharacterized protein (DUF342 family)